VRKAKFRTKYAWYYDEISLYTQPICPASGRKGVSGLTSRTYRFPKSRSKYFKDALKLAKGLPGYAKVKGHHHVTYGPTDAATDDLWELIKTSSHWKGAAFLIDDKEVEQDVWEKSFQDASGAEAPGTEEETTEQAVDDKPEAKKPEKAVEAEPEAKKPEKAVEAEPEAKKPEKAVEAEPEAKKPEKAVEAEPEAKKPEKAKEAEPEAKEPEKAKEAEPEAKEPEKAKEAEPEAKKPEKAKEAEPEAKKPVPSKPKVVQINPAPKPDNNSGCGKKAAVLMIAAMMGILSFFR
jgi:hypothetical protein